jgi:hypothetical protein
MEAMAPRGSNQERFSNPTAAALIEVVAEVYSHSELDVLFIRLGAEGQDLFENGEQGNRLKRTSNVVTYLRYGKRDISEPDLLDLIKELLEERLGDHVFTNDGDIQPAYQRLIGSLRADGFEFSAGRIVSTTPEPASMARELTRLEEDLKEQNLEVALRHYRQAIENHRDDNLEASNGQLRSFLESLLIALAKEETSKSSKDPKGAIDRLFNAKVIDGDEAQLLRGLVGLSNKRGAHHGLTDEEEALFRLHFSTAAARYLLAIAREEDD